jgi:hypothetical protein
MTDVPFASSRLRRQIPRVALSSFMTVSMRLISRKGKHEVLRAIIYEAFATLGLLQGGNNVGLRAGSRVTRE